MKYNFSEVIRILFYFLLVCFAIVVFTKYFTCNCIENLSIAALEDKPNTYKSIIVTHQARIRCLLSTIYGKKMGRFKNCAILRIDVTHDKIVTDLYYEGKLDENKQNKKYYVIPKGRDIYADNNYIPENFQVHSISNDKIIIPQDSTYIFFLIRHGQGEHNILTGNEKRKKQIVGDKILDASLTNKGVEQAIDAGNVMKADDLFKSSNFYFCSDLKRAMYTLMYILSIVYPGDNMLNIDVLPCAHELTYMPPGKIMKKKINCDRKQTFTPKENRFDNKRLVIPDITVNNTNYTINWNTYKIFYKNKYRRVNNPSARCKFTNLLKEATYIINPELLSTKLTKSEDNVIRRMSRWRSKNK